MKPETQNFREAGGEGTQYPRYVVEINFDPDTTVNKVVNGVLHSRVFDNAAWLQVGTPVITPNTDDAPDGTTLVADTINDNDAVTNTEAVYQDFAASFNVLNGYNASLAIKKDAVARTTRFCSLELEFSGSTTEVNKLLFDTSDGVFIAVIASQELFYAVEDHPDDSNWWRVYIRARSLDGANTSCRMRFAPAAGADIDFTESVTATGSAVISDAQLSETYELQAYYDTTIATVSDDIPAPDFVYFTSHAGTLLPLDFDNPGQVITGVVQKISGQTQKINPDRAQSTIGNITFSLLDLNQAISTVIKAKLDDDKGLRKKTIRLYRGYESLTDFSDYQLEFTYLIDNTSYKDGLYKIICSDIQRTTKQDIFDPHVGNLTSTISASATTIPVTIAAPAEKYPLLEHDAIYSGNPSTTVGYVRIDKEIIAHSGWNGPFTGLNVVERGALGTLAVQHVVTATETEKKKKVEEYIYLEMAAPRMIYAILTGVIDGQTGNMPDHWNLSIDESLVRLANFQNIGVDLWDTVTNRGRIARFMGLEKVEGKAFVEEELLLWLGAFMPIYADGAYGLKRMLSVLPYAAFDEFINASSVLSYSDLKYDQTKVINNIAIKWNYLDSQDRFTKVTQLIDSASIAKYGSASQKTFEFKGVFTGVHTDTDIINYFTQLRDRYGAPPMRLQLKCLPWVGRVEVGDTIRLRHANIIDVRTLAGIDRVFEVQQVRTNWVDGTVTLDLFGGTEEASQDVISGTFVMQDAFYNTRAVTDGSTELSTAITIVGGAMTVNGTIGTPGVKTIYHFDSDLTINTGITLTVQGSVELRVKGTLIVNGDIDGVGNGLAGGLGADGSGNNRQYGLIGQPGMMGYYGFTIQPILRGGDGANLFGGPYPFFTQPPQTPPNSLNIINPDGLEITGVPNSLQGTSGNGGNAVMRSNPPVPPNTMPFLAAGGNGGDSGAGLNLIVRGMAFGASGAIDISGANGLQGGSTGFDGSTTYGSPGVGGSAGVALILIDGNASSPTKSKITAMRGNSNIPSANVYWDKDFPTAFTATVIRNGLTYTPVPYFQDQDQQAEHISIRYIPEALEPFVYLPPEEEDAATGYENKPPEWEEIVDSAGTIPADSATVGAQSGVNLENSSGTPLGDADVQNSDQLPEDVNAGTMTGVEVLTSGSGQRIRLSTAGDELEFYGDRGDTTVTQVATIGIRIVGPDTVIGLFGDVAIGNSNVGVYGATYDGTAGVFGASGIRNGVYGVSQSIGNTYAGVYGTGADSAGVRGVSTNRYGVWGSTSALVDTLEKTAGIVGSIGAGGANTDSVGGWFYHSVAEGVPLFISPDVSTDTPATIPPAGKGSFWFSNDTTNLLFYRQEKQVGAGDRWRGLGALNQDGQLHMEKGAWAVSHATSITATTLDLDFQLHQNFHIIGFSGACTIDLINEPGPGTFAHMYITMKDPNDATSITWLAGGVGSPQVIWPYGEPTWIAGDFLVYAVYDGYVGDVKLYNLGASSTTGGDVTAVPTPVGNQLAIWTGATSVKGDAALTFNSTFNQLLVGDQGLSQPEISISGPASSIGKLTWRIAGVEEAVIRWRETNQDLEFEFGGTYALYLSATDVRANQRLTTIASVAGAAGFNVPHGLAPTAPVNGDIWTTTTSMFARINGVTVDLVSGTGIGGSIADNQIAVGAATANEIEGSSGLTFDGSDFNATLGAGGDFIVTGPTNVNVQFGPTGVSTSNGNLNITGGTLGDANINFSQNTITRASIQRSNGGFLRLSEDTLFQVFINSNRVLDITENTVDVTSAVTTQTAFNIQSTTLTSGVLMNVGTNSALQNGTAIYFHQDNASATGDLLYIEDLASAGTMLSMYSEGSGTMGLIYAGGGANTQPIWNIDNATTATNTNNTLLLNDSTQGHTLQVAKTGTAGNIFRAVINSATYSDTMMQLSSLNASTDVNVLEITNNGVGLAMAVTGNSEHFGNFTMTGGKLATVASAAVAGAGFTLPHGVAPTTPVNGDIWTTTAGLFTRINGVTRSYVYDGEVNSISSGMIQATAVENTKISNRLALSVMGRATNSIGAPGDIVAGTDGHVLTRVGATLAFAAPAAGGVTAVGTPTTNRVALWASATSIKDDAAFSFNPTFNQLLVGDQGLSQPEISISGPASSIGKLTWRVAGVEEAIIRYRDTANELEFQFTGAAYAMYMSATEVRAGKIFKTIASAAAGAGFNLPHGAAPTTPVNGDMWTTTAGVFTRVNGVTVDLTATGGGGGGGFTYTAQSGAYTAAVDDFVDATGTVNQTITLPSGHSAGDRIAVKKTGATGLVTVDANGTETIDGSLTYVIAAQYASVTLISNGTNWLIM